MHNQRKNKIAVTVITGFLGAGKTTFINSVLQTYSDIQFALVENEFGDIAIDTHLIKGVDASQMFELKDGCICCTITNEYESILEELAERFLHVEHLLIETTGIADPVSVIRPFLREEKLQQLYSFNKSVCMVDAIHFNHQPEKEIALKQLAVADEVIVTKTENLPEEQKEKLVQTLKEINPLAEIDFAGFGKVRSFNLLTPAQKNSISGFDATNEMHSHLKTKTITSAIPVNKKDFLHRFGYNLDIYKNQIYRVKGILCFESEIYESVLQGVGGNFMLKEGERLITHPESKLVLIGNWEKLEFDVF